MLNRLQKSGRGVPNLVISRRVLDKMAAAAERYLQDETGEALVGLLAPGTHTNGVPTVYVLDTISPDDSAVREWATFQQGDELQQERFWWLLENWRVYRAGGRSSDGKPLPPKWDVPLIHVGDWHKQPGFMIQPSQGDLMTARRMLDDSEFGMEFLIAPIVTLGHPSTISPSANTNFVTIPQGDDTSLRVDFWYLDRISRDFQPINPAVYPAEQLPLLPDYPWHMKDEPRFNGEYALLEKDGLFVSAPVLWDALGDPPLEICFLLARADWEQILLLVTPAAYPAQPPSARVAPFVNIGPEDDIVEIFEQVWAESTPVTNPPDWTWTEGRHLLDYVYALETALNLKIKTPQQPASDSPSPSDGEGIGDEVSSQ